MNATTNRIRRFIVGALAAGAVAGLSPLTLPGDAAEAALPQGYVYSTVTYNTDNTFSSNGSTTFSRTAPGRYTLFAANLGGKGTAQLTVWDTGDRLPVCTVSSVARLARGTRIQVRCTNPDTGAGADAVFSLLYSSQRWTDPNVGYVALSTASTGSGTPSNQFRSRGTGRVTVRRQATGTYRVSIPNESLNPNLGVVMVSATGSARRYCNPMGWYLDAGSTYVDVRCFTPTGALANATFSLIATTHTMLGTAFAPGATAWSPDWPRTASPTNLSGAFTYNSSGGQITHQNVGDGQAVVKFEGVTNDFTLVVMKLAVAYGSDVRCAHLGLHGLDGYDVSLNVRCQTPAGVAAVSSFNVMVDSFGSLL